MSKPVFGLLAGLAVLAAAGRARRGSFSRYTVYAKSAVEARERFLRDHPGFTIDKVEVDERYGSGPGLPDLNGRYEYIVHATPKGSRGSRAHDEDRDFGTYSWGLTPQKVIRQAVDHHVGEAGTYPIESHQSTDALSFLLQANEKAKISPFRFQGSYGRVGFNYGRTELVKLLAALKEMDDSGEFEGEGDSPGMLRSDILQTLGIEEV